MYDARALEVAVTLSALSGGLTCVAVLILFLDEVRGTAAAKVLFVSFGGAIILTMAALAALAALGALGAFVTEVLLAARVIRWTAARRPNIT